MTRKKSSTPLGPCAFKNIRSTQKCWGEGGMHNRRPSFMLVPAPSTLLPLLPPRLLHELLVLGPFAALSEPLPPTRGSPWESHPLVLYTPKWSILAHRTKPTHNIILVKMGLAHSCVSETHTGVLRKRIFSFPNPLKTALPLGFQHNGFKNKAKLRGSGARPA